MKVWFATCFLEPAYVIYSVVVFFIEREGYEQYQDVVNAFLFVGLLNIFNRIFLLYVGVKVYKSFGRGLKKIWFKERNENQVDEFTPLNVDLWFVRKRHQKKRKEKKKKRKRKKKKEKERKSKTKE